MKTTDEKIDSLWRKFCPEDSFATATPPAPSGWWHATGTAPTGAYDGSEADALRFASFGLKPDGQIGVRDTDLGWSRAYCDDLSRIDLLGNSPDVARYFVMTGYVQNGGPGSFNRPSVTVIAATLADAIKIALGQTVTGGQAHTG